MSYWDCRAGGVLEFVADDAALDLTLREVFADGKLTVCVHASGTQYAIIKTTAPPGITITHNTTAQPRQTKRSD